jgi:hypothetical protein
VLCCGERFLSELGELEGILGSSNWLEALSSGGLSDFLTQ